jgi:phage FluMu protein Com
MVVEVRCCDCNKLISRFDVTEYDNNSPVRCLSCAKRLLQAKPSRHVASSAARRPSQQEVPRRIHDREARMQTFKEVYRRFKGSLRDAGGSV